MRQDSPRGEKVALPSLKHKTLEPTPVEVNAKNRESQILQQCSPGTGKTVLFLIAVAALVLPGLLG